MSQLNTTNRRSMDQVVVDEYAASSDAFWETFLEYLERDYHPHPELRGRTASELRRVVASSPWLEAAVGQLWGHTVPLEGEALVTGTAGTAVLTNFRLHLVVDGTRYNIPLYELEEYEFREGVCRLRGHRNDQPVELEFQGEFIHESTVHHAMDWAESDALDESARLLVEAPRDADFLDGLTLPTVGQPGSPMVEKKELTTTDIVLGSVYALLALIFWSMLVLLVVGGKARSGIGLLVIASITSVGAVRRFGLDSRSEDDMSVLDMRHPVAWVLLLLILLGVAFCFVTVP